MRFLVYFNPVASGQEPKAVPWKIRRVK